MLVEIKYNIFEMLDILEKFLKKYFLERHFHHGLTLHKIDFLTILIGDVH